MKPGIGLLSRVEDVLADGDIKYILVSVEALNADSQKALKSRHSPSSVHGDSKKGTGWEEVHMNMTNTRTMEEILHVRVEQRAGSFARSCMRMECPPCQVRTGSMSMATRF